MALYPSELTSASVVNKSESQASIRFIEDDGMEQPSNEFESMSEGPINKVENEISFPKTGQKKSNHLEVLGILSLILMLYLNKNKKIE